ncbi:TIGR02117 family protein [Pontibacter russatus]|uniref:TIGR02117 family protein n=1 Tax=Pontibacter russatus TaxID=2694929 RepID=UPI0013799C30|nr:TIGR02117 family protein [Pontibacter russatus]
MRRMLYKIITFFLLAVGTVAGAVVLFLLSAFLLSSFPVRSSFAQAPHAEEPVEIFVTSNGVHTDIVVPVATPYTDWREKVPLHHFANADSSYTHLSFGWGDREFYMKTPSWSDLTPGVALRAALWPTPTAMHVEYIASRLTPTKRQLPVLLTPEQYRQLVLYIDASFQKENGGYRHITGSGYTGQDTFYEAHGKFYILKNCNNWVNGGLKAAGVKAALWAPLPFAVMRHLR